MDYKYRCVIDSNGNYDRLVLAELSGADEPQVQGYVLADGQQLVDAPPPACRQYAGAPGMIAPVWVAETTAWAEGATTAEIAAWEAEHSAPEVGATQFDRVEAQAAYTAMMTNTLLEG